MENLPRIVENTLFVLKLHKGYPVFRQMAQRGQGRKTQEICEFSRFKKSLCEDLTHGDDLGRVVIPKEIRRTLKIREGMPMEIFTDISGEVILKKYSPVGEMSQLAEAYAEALVTLTGLGAAICDGEQVIAAAGPGRKELLHKAISPQVEEVIEGKKGFVGGGEAVVPGALGGGGAALAVFPVVSLGDVMGGVLLLKGEKAPARVSQEAVESARAAALFLSRQLET